MDEDQHPDGQKLEDERADAMHADLGRAAAAYVGGTQAGAAQANGRGGEASTALNAEVAALASHLVALLFAADEPLLVADASRILGARRRLVERAVELLLESPPLGLIVQRDGDRLQLATDPTSAAYVRRLRGLADQARLSRAGLEVLAVIAYRQPITRAEIEAVRGVGGDRALATLIQRGLVEEVGRKDTVGRPVLFGTTLTFLENLGLRSLADLPAVPRPDEPSAAARAADAEDGTGGA